MTGHDEQGDLDGYDDTDDTDYDDGYDGYDDTGYQDDGPDDDSDPDRARFDLRALVTRRRFLAGLATTGAAGSATLWALTRGGEVAAPPTATTVPPAAPVVAAGPGPAPAVIRAVDALPGVLVPAPVDQRILVLIEFEGGNDGASTLVPAGSGTYYDLRPRLAIADETVLRLDDEVGLNPGLARLYRHQLAVVEGVGPVDGSLSHFEMAARWESGDPSGQRRDAKGFLARLADQLDNGGISVGLSVSGFTPRFNNVTANTLSIDEIEQLWVLTEDEWIYPAFRRAVAGFSGGPMTNRIAASWNELLTIGNALPGNLDDISKDDPMIAEGGDIGRSLAAAAAMLKADVGVKVIHAKMSGFDTHEGHEWRYKDLMAQLDVALDGFLAKMAEYGLAERVLVATSSEFGRRMKQNGSGFDHGAASTMLLFGPVMPGRYGQAPPLGDLDPLGNLKTTVPFDVYLGTLAQVWLGVEAAAVLPTAPEVLPILGDGQ